VMGLYELLGNPTT